MAVKHLGLGQLGSLVQNQLPNFDYDDDYITKAYNKLYNSLREWSRSFYCDTPESSGTLEDWIKKQTWPQRYEESHLENKKCRRFFVESVVAIALSKWVFETKAITTNKDIKSKVDGLAKSLDGNTVPAHIQPSTAFSEGKTDGV
jgi:hypothetical protein